MTAAESKLTRTEAQDYLRRFPAQGLGTVALNVALVLVGNGIVLWLLMSGRMQGAHLVALVMVETVLLIAFAHAAQVGIPQKDRVDEPKPWKERIGMLAFLLVWLGGAYGITLVVLEQWREFLALFQSKRAWLDAGLHWPLAWTLVLAVLHTIGDRVHYAARGGKFFSTASHDAMARMLTLIFGGIPFAMPFFVVTIGGFKAVEFIARKAKLDPAKSVAAGIATMVVGFGGFALVGRLIENEVGGWAIGYVLAKAVSELLVASIPYAMTEAAKQEQEKGTG